MEPTVRASLNWLHTWAGVTLGGLLFAIFWTGTLSVFDREIDRWMAPMTRKVLPSAPIPVETLRPLLERAASARSPVWSVTFPTERHPVFRVTWRENNRPVLLFLDPASGHPLTDAGTLGGTRFLYPFHYMLHLRFMDLGVWLVGLASMMMLVLCVTGVVIHRKILAEFFVLRTERKPRRLILDLHNVTGILGLPFLFGITISGLVVFWFVYFSGPWQISYPDRAAFVAEAFGSFGRPRLNEPAIVSSLDGFVTKAQKLWNGEGPFLLSVHHPGDRAAYATTFRPDDHRVSAIDEAAYFDAVDGQLLRRREMAQPAGVSQRFISGVHLVRFRHWSLRWLYFALGLSGCVTIATGYLFWLESRRTKHAQLELRGVGVVEGLTIGSVTGILIATLAFFVVNRLLPLGVTFLGQERAALEIWAFYIVWFAAFAHAWTRSSRAWIEQCWTIATLCVAAVMLNWITTGDHLARSLAHRHLWAIASMDLLLLVGAAISAVSGLVLLGKPNNSARITKQSDVSESQD